MVRYVVVGGGVAGVCCIEELCRLCPHDTVTLVSPDKTLKVTLRPSADIRQGTSCYIIAYERIETQHFGLQGVSTVARITRTIEELKGRPSLNRWLY